MAVLLPDSRCTFSSSTGLSRPSSLPSTRLRDTSYLFPASSLRPVWPSSPSSSHAPMPTFSGSSPRALRTASCQLPPCGGDTGGMWRFFFNGWCLTYCGLGPRFGFLLIFQPIHFVFSKLHPPKFLPSPRELQRRMATLQRRRTRRRRRLYNAGLPGSPSSGWQKFHRLRDFRRVRRQCRRQRDSSSRIFTQCTRKFPTATHQFPSTTFAFPAGNKRVRFSDTSIPKQLDGKLQELASVQGGGCHGLCL